jgi:hypothetical protein
MAIRFHHMRKVKLLSALAISLCSAWVSSVKAADETRASASEIKAAFLYNFFLFVTWPSLPEQTVTIGILGRDPFDKAFAEVANKPVRGLKKQLTVKRLGPYIEETDLNQCQILFISSSEREHFKKIFSRLQAKPVLTVGDSEGFLEAGGMVNFLMIQDKVRWEISQRQVNASGLRMDSQLLGAAVRIKSN